MKILIYGILLGILLYLAAMIDTRGQEKSGTCIVGEYTFHPIINHDCQGKFISDD